MTTEIVFSDFYRYKINEIENVWLEYGVYVLREEACYMNVQINVTSVVPEWGRARH